MKSFNSSSTKLTPLQLELLRIYSHNPSEQELKEIRELLANYYSDKLVAKVDKAIEDNGVTQRDIDEWLNEKS